MVKSAPFHCELKAPAAAFKERSSNFIFESSENATEVRLVCLQGEGCSTQASLLGDDMKTVQAIVVQMPDHQ